MGCNFVSDPPNNVCCRAVILAINVTAEQIVSAEIFAKHTKTLKPHLSVCVLCMELHTELNKDWRGGRNGESCQPIKTQKQQQGEKKTLPCLSPAPFTSNILLPLKQKKQSFEHCFEHTAIQDVSTKMCMQGFQKWNLMVTEINWPNQLYTY